MGRVLTIKVPGRRLMLLLILAVLLFGEKTPTACKGPPGDTGGGGWRIASSPSQLCYGCRR